MKSRRQLFWCRSLTCSKFDQGVSTLVNFTWLQFNAAVLALLELDLINLGKANLVKFTLVRYTLIRHTLPILYYLDKIYLSRIYIDVTYPVDNTLAKATWVKWAMNLPSGGDFKDWRTRLQVNLVDHLVRDYKRQCPHRNGYVLSAISKRLLPLCFCVAIIVIVADVGGENVSKASKGTQSVMDLIELIVPIVTSPKDRWTVWKALLF